MKCLVLLLVIFLLITVVKGRGGEHPKYVVDGHWVKNESSPSLRQSVCDRYQQFSEGKVELRDALSGLSIRTVIPFEGTSKNFFHYHSSEGIDIIDPGIYADILDALADRANFTWRNSFALGLPSQFNLTSTDFLLWSIDNFDLSIGWYDKSNERMEKGVFFMEPWYDGSMILVDQRNPPAESKINYLNWKKPFDNEVWGLIIFTIILSGFVYQLIEHLNGEREERPLFQWVSDNMYLSSLNFTQNFEYAPNSVAGRIFGVGASIWALVITATYTANLASLFVEQQKPGQMLESIEHAIVLGMPICVLKGSNHERILQKKYRNAELVPGSEFENYNALRRGDCGLVAAAKDSWLTYKMNSKYNPDCDLQWVGREVKRIQSGFAVKADSGNLCSGFISHVLDLHMVEFINDGGLDEAWQKYRLKTRDNSCAASPAQTPTTPFGGVQRHLESKQQPSPKEYISPSQLSFQSHRILKGGGGGGTSASSANGASGETDHSGLSLSVDQMIGTFLFHWCAMAVAILVSISTFYYDKWEKKMLAEKDLVRERIIFRRNGPIIGSPPRANTTAIRDVSDASCRTRISHDVSSRHTSMGVIDRSRRTTIKRNNTRGYATQPLIVGDMSESCQTYDGTRRDIIESIEESTSAEPQDTLGAVKEIPEWLRRSVEEQQECLRRSVEEQQERQSCNEKRMERIEEQLAAVLELLKQQ